MGTNRILKFLERTWVEIFFYMEENKPVEIKKQSFLIFLGDTSQAQKPVSSSARDSISLSGDRALFTSSFPSTSLSIPDSSSQGDHDNPGQCIFLGTPTEHLSPTEDDCIASIYLSICFLVPHFLIFSSNIFSHFQSTIFSYLCIIFGSKLHIHSANPSPEFLAKTKDSSIS